MRKSTVLKILGAIALAAVLLASMRAIGAARSYADCVSRIVTSAPATDSSPPATFRQLSTTFWGHRDLALARVLAAECTTEPSGDFRRRRRELFALGIVKTRLSWPQRVTLSSIFLPAHGGRGLTHSAQTEWGRPPASLDESEMTWLFVVGQNPNCSKRAASEKDRQFCDSLYQSLLARHQK